MLRFFTIYFVCFYTLNNVYPWQTNTASSFNRHETLKLKVTISYRTAVFPFSVFFSISISFVHDGKHVLQTERNVDVKVLERHTYNNVGYFTRCHEISNADKIIIYAIFWLFLPCRFPIIFGSEMYFPNRAMLEDRLKRIFAYCVLLHKVLTVFTFTFVNWW